MGATSAEVEETHLGTARRFYDARRNRARKSRALEPVRVIVRFWDQYRLDDVRNDRHEQDVSGLECGTADDVSADSVGFRAVGSPSAFREESRAGAAGAERDHGPVRREPRISPYHPAMMTALILYAYTQGIYASRRIAGACEQRVDFMAVTGMQQPIFEPSVISGSDI